VVADPAIGVAATEAELAGLVPDLAISPAGTAYLETSRGEADSPSSAAVMRIRKAFERSGAHGLLQLGAAELGSTLPPGLAFGREFAHLFMARPRIRPMTRALAADQWTCSVQPQAMPINDVRNAEVSRHRPTWWRPWPLHART